uniref:Endopeptidase La n=1 Tax=Alloyangia mangrovi TaxID=1779329 RepID=A0A2A3JYD6_9RHOB
MTETRPPEPASFEIPEDALILLPVRDFVGFPGTVFPLSIGRPSSVAAVERALRDDLPIGILLQRAPQEDAPDAAGLHDMGCLAEILRYVTTPDEGRHLICRGRARFRPLELIPDAPFLVAKVEAVEDIRDTRPETEARFLHLRELAVQLLHMLPEAPEGLAESVAQIDDPGYLADLAAGYSEMSTDERQEMLETVEVAARIEAMTRKLSRRVEVLRITREINEQAREELEGRHREVILREQLAAIRRELGETGAGNGEEVAELSRAIMAAGMPEETERHALAELGRYGSMAPGSAEVAMLRGWIDTILDLPWRLPEKTPVDLAEARRTLDADHYGLEKIKMRIIEYLAVRRLAPAGKAPILCFVGPPGVGKTSLGQSIARALHRPFARLSLGGVHDEAEIRGHRRTYVGAMPGTVIQQIRRAGARNCVLMLDEIEAMPAAIQPKLLRALQERAVERLGENHLRPLDLRVIATSKTDLRPLTLDGSFRADLFYRLAGAEITVEPLRVLGEDIALLFSHYANLAAARYGQETPSVDYALRQRLMRRPWPGNVRELKAMAERFALGLDLPEETAAPIGEPESLAARVAAFEAREISLALERCRGNTERAAKALGMARRTLNDKISRYGIRV